MSHCADVTLRDAVPADAEAIFRVHISAIRDVASSHYSAGQIEAWAGRLSPGLYRSPIHDKVLLLATDAAHVCGFGQLDPQAAVIEAVYVLPSHLRRGIGRRLLSALEAAAWDEHLAELTLDASLNSVQFYERAGYTCIRRANHEVGAGMFIPCVVMAKQLERLPPSRSR